MEFRKLQYIITIAQEGTLLAAAEKLFVSASALSQFVNRLEEDLQTPLFHRTKGGWVPTCAGQIYLDMAREVLMIQKSASLQIGEIAENKLGCFTVGVTPGRGTQMFSTVYPRFHSLYPNVKVGLYEGTVLQINQMIATGKVDIGFITGILEHPDVRTIHQADERIVLAVPKTHPAAALAKDLSPGEMATVDLTRFREDEFLLAGEGTTLRTLTDRAFAAAGYSPKIAFETVSVTTLNALASSGFGMAFLPEYYRREQAEAVYFYTEPPLSWEWLAASRRGSYLTKAEEAMIGLVTEYYRAQNSKSGISSEAHNR